MVAYCKCEFRDADGTAVPGEPCQIHPRGTKNMSKHTPGPWEFDGVSRIDALQFRRLSPFKVKDENGVEQDYMQGLVALPYGCGGSDHNANAKLIAAAPDMFDVLDSLEDSLDKQIYPQQKEQDFDAPDDHEYTVTITAKQWREIGLALAKAGA